MEIFKGTEKENTTTKKDPKQTKNKQTNNPTKQKKNPNNPKETGFGKLTGLVPALGLTLVVVTDTPNLSASLLKMAAPGPINTCAYSTSSLFLSFPCAARSQSCLMEEKVNVKAGGALLPC